jgi:hypothetical protein
MENPNATNSTCNCKNVSTTFEIRPIMCIIGDLKKNKTKVGCYNKVENVKMC